jgi:N-acetyl-anhydromuramyl-L-alanine amidase AmpD
MGLFDRLVEVPSPNRRPGRRADISHIVLHVMDGTLAGTDAWFSNPASQVSAHYGIGRKGELRRYVREEDEAWHAGRILNPSVRLRTGPAGAPLNPNAYTIGIELEGWAREEPTLAQYYTLALLLQDISRRRAVPLDAGHVWLHREIFAAKTCPGRLDRELALRLARLP